MIEALVVDTYKYSSILSNIFFSLANLSNLKILINLTNFRNFNICALYANAASLFEDFPPEVISSSEFSSSVGIDPFSSIFY